MIGWEVEVLQQKSATEMLYWRRYVLVVSVFETTPQTKRVLRRF